MILMYEKRKVKNSRRPLDPPKLLMELSISTIDLKQQNPNPLECAQNPTSPGC